VEATDLVLTFEGDAPARCTLTEMLDANADDPDVCEAARSLKPGESVTFGGGAAPLVTLSRLEECTTAATGVTTPARCSPGWCARGTRASAPSRRR